MEITLETARFRGSKTLRNLRVYLSLGNGQEMEARFTITADSQDGPVP